MTATAAPSTTMDTPFISVRGLGKSFGSQLIYERFDLDLPRGKFTTVFGPNGTSRR
jgi:NitT/TauT family transport system ATP-binding protein